MKRNNYYIERKCNLFYDYSNSYNAENIRIIPKNKSFLSNFYYYPNNNINTNNNKKCNNINIEMNSSSLSKSIKERKEKFNKICNSINSILSKYKKERIKNNDDYKNLIKKNKYSNLENKSLNANRIAEHLIKTYSKEELKLIKEKINAKVEEDEEPKPEIFLPKYSPKKFNKELLLNHNIIKKDFLKKNNKTKTSNKSTKPKPKKENEKIVYNKTSNERKNSINKRNTKVIVRRNIDNNLDINPNFLTYIKCKTSFECLDNFLKKRKSKKGNKNKHNINKTSVSSKISTKYLIKSNKLKRVKTEKQEYSFTPIKYVNHKYDYVKSLYKNDDQLLERIKEQTNKKLKKYQRIKTEQNNEELEQCTFKPDIHRSMIKSIKQGKYNSKLDGEIIKKENDNKNFSYLEFYQYKMNRERTNKEGNEKEKEIKKSLTLNKIPKRLKEMKSEKKVKNSNNKKFLQFHQLIIQKSLKEINGAKN